MAVNVSVAFDKDEIINAGQLSVSSSSRDMVLKSLSVGSIAFFLHFVLSIGFQFL